MRPDSVIRIRSEMIQTLSMDLKPEHRLRVYARLMAKRAKNTWGENLIVPAVAKQIGIRQRRLGVNGVPLRVTTAYDIREGRLLRRIDVMGYPPEAVLK